MPTLSVSESSLSLSLSLPSLSLSFSFFLSHIDTHTQESTPDPKFRDSFLITYRAFTSPESLFDQLVERYSEKEREKRMKEREKRMRGKEREEFVLKGF